MSPLYLIPLALSATIIALATMAEAGGIRRKVQGATGFILFITLVVSGLGAALTALIALFADSFIHVLYMVILAALWHWGAFKITTGFLQRVAKRVNP